MNETAYVAVMATDDSRARQDCEVRLVFGHVEVKQAYSFDWKWVNLPCPSCEFVHQFKRESSFSEVPVGGDAAHAPDICKPK